MGMPPSQPAQVPKEEADTVATDLQSVLDAGKISPEYIDLPKGKELNESAALDLAKSRPVQWIVLAGPSDSGETTFLTSLYELFQWRRAGWPTQRGFRCVGTSTSYTGNEKFGRGEKRYATCGNASASFAFAQVGSLTLRETWGTRRGGQCRL